MGTSIGRAYIRPRAGGFARFPTMRFELHCHSTCSDGTEAPERVALHLLDAGRRRDVRHDRERLAAALPDRLRDLVRGGRAPVDDDDRRAVGREGLGDRAADAAARAGHEGDLRIEGGGLAVEHGKRENICRLVLLPPFAIELAHLGIVREQQARRQPRVGQLGHDLGSGIGGALGEPLPIGDRRPRRLDVDVELDQLFPS